MQYTETLCVDTAKPCRGVKLLYCGNKQRSRCDFYSHPQVVRLMHVFEK